MNGGCTIAAACIDVQLNLVYVYPYILLTTSMESGLDMNIFTAVGKNKFSLFSWDEFT